MMVDWLNLILHNPMGRLTESPGSPGPGSPGPGSPGPGSPGPGTSEVLKWFIWDIKMLHIVKNFFSIIVNRWYHIWMCTIVPICQTDVCIFFYNVKCPLLCLHTAHMHIQSVNCARNGSSLVLSFCMQHGLILLNRGRVCPGLYSNTLSCTWTCSERGHVGSGCRTHCW